MCRPQSPSIPEEEVPALNMPGLIEEDLFPPVENWDWEIAEAAGIVAPNPPAEDWDREIAEAEAAGIVVPPYRANVEDYVSVPPITLRKVVDSEGRMCYKVLSGSFAGFAGIIVAIRS